MEYDGWAGAFSPAGLAGQLVFLLLVAAVLQTRIARSRAFLAAAGLAGAAHALLLRGDVVAALWWAILLGAALLIMGRRAVEDARVRFTAEEEELLKGAFASLPRSRARHLLDQGFWLSGKAGDVLLREEEPVSHLYYLAAGRARVLSHGRQIAMCHEGELVGEVALLSGEQATATVILDSAARFWCAPAAVLRTYLQTHEDVRRALEAGFAKSIKHKLRQSNERIAEAGGVTA